MVTRVEKNKKKRERSRREHEENLRALAVQNEFSAAMQRILIALNIDPIYLKQLPDYVKKILVHLRNGTCKNISVHHEFRYS
jgi:hypothetical protein